MHCCTLLCSHLLLTLALFQWSASHYLYKDNWMDVYCTLYSDPVSSVQYSIRTWSWNCFDMVLFLVVAIRPDLGALLQLSQDCLKSWIQSQSSGLQIWRSRLREDCDNPKELVLGIAGHWEDCKWPSSTCLGLPSSQDSDLTNSR